MRRATLEERENLCRLAKKFGGRELTEFIASLTWQSRRRHMTGQQLLSILFNSPGQTDLPEDRLKAAARKLHEQGQEMTPEQVGETIALVCHKLRVEMARHGYEMPESDTELIRHLKELGVRIRG